MNSTGEKMKEGRRKRGNASTSADYRRKGNVTD